MLNDSHSSAVDTTVVVGYRNAINFGLSIGIIHFTDETKVLAVGFNIEA